MFQLPLRNRVAECIGCYEILLPACTQLSIRFHGRDQKLERRRARERKSQTLADGGGMTKTITVSSRALFQKALCCWSIQGFRIIKIGDWFGGGWSLDYNERGELVRSRSKLRVISKYNIIRVQVGTTPSFLAYLTSLSIFISHCDACSLVRAHLH